MSGRSAVMDRETRWAFTAAFDGRRRKRRGCRRPGCVCTAYGRTVYRSTRTWPFGTSTHRRARLVHLVDAVYTAWEGGQLVGAMVRWMCGAYSARYRLLSAWDGDVCLVCAAAVLRAQEIAAGGC
ncbi:hypothetical protein AB0395_34990 [Streptosporangium sp. NPDC051023]|uniref:hypothetical protein n=1 Tax=Streptosporangium sp. NPDC051023 TaxID=3155410 RepID=UPI00345105A0